MVPMGSNDTWLPFKHLSYILIYIFFLPLMGWILPTTHLEFTPYTTRPPYVPKPDWSLLFWPFFGIFLLLLLGWTPFLCFGFCVCAVEMDSSHGLSEEVEGEAVRDSDEVEWSKIGIVRAVVEREDPSAKDIDDLMIRRFLRARDLDVDKASKMFLMYLNWRRSFVPHGSISAMEVPNELAQNKVFMQGADKLGHPIVVVYGARHKPFKSTLEEFKRFVVFSLDKVCSRMPAGQEKFIVIGDLQGWGYTNSDIRGYLASLSIFQDCYPERLGKLFIIHVPNIFMTAWKMVYPFIDSRIKKKIVFVENKKLTQTLLGDIDESQIPDVYGGKLPLVPIQDC